MWQNTAKWLTAVYSSWEPLGLACETSILPACLHETYIEGRVLTANKLSNSYMEQHKSEGHMLFCLGMEPLVTHSHTHYQLHFVLFKLKHLVAKQHPISVYPPATVSDCLMDPAVYSKLQSVWCITWLWSEGFMPWVGGLEDTREFSHTRHTFTAFREHMRRKLLHYHYILYICAVVGVKNIKREYVK